MPSPQFSSFVFTHWIQDEDDQSWWEDAEAVRADLATNANFRYAHWQLELKEDHFQIHVQGYFQIFGDTTVAGILKWESRFLRGSNIEGARGTLSQNQAYTGKAETRYDGPWSYGTPSKAGRPATLDALAADVLRDRDIARVARDNPGQFVRHGRGLQLLLTATDTMVRDFKTRVIVHIGPPGSGKTHDTPIDAYYLRRGNGGAVWWDGFDGVSDVVIDDYYGWMPWGTILCLLDNRPMRVDTKGGSVSFRARRIFITSNRHPNSWYKYAENGFDYGALARRIDEFYVYSGSFKGGDNTRILAEP